MIREDILLETYSQTTAINNTWKVIYNEAIRNNHILFDNIDEIKTRPLIKQHDQLQEVEDIATHLIFGTNLTSMKRHINRLKIDQQVILFALYKGLIDHIRYETKQNLN